MSSTDAAAFELGSDFVAGETGGGLALGATEQEYEQMFSAVLDDGVITPEERKLLEREASRLGLDAARLVALEQALLAAYQRHHKVRVVEHFGQQDQEDVGVSEPPPDADHTALRAQIRALQLRVRELEGELVKAQANLNVEVDLGELEDIASSASEDPNDAWRAVRRDPSDVEALRGLYRIYEARGAADEQGCVAQALVALGAANGDEQACYEGGKQAGLIAPSRSLSPASWDKWLLHPEQEPITGQLLAYVTPAALLGRVTALKRAGALYVPAPESRVDPGKATVTAVRALGWAATLMGLPAPPVYLDKTRDAGFEHIPAMPPLSLIGKQALSGKSQAELAFLAGRHLAWYRRESYIRCLLPSVPDLEEVFLAALLIANPALPLAGDKKARVQPTAAAIEPMLNAASIDGLRRAFAQFLEEGGRTNLQRYAMATEFSACRAGVLLCGDLPTAAKLLEAEEGPGGEMLKDLIVFATGQRYFELRSELGIRLA